MKLHGIEVKNLNSLYGKYEIDFHRDLKDAPIFLIVGPTGAGKSTLMDAISLALFGQTPRLTRARGQEDRDSRMVMSHGTAECSAAIEFSKADPDGKRRRYRAEWSCLRAHKKPSGKLKDPQRSLSVYEDNGTKRILVSSDKAKDFDPCFAEVLQGFTAEDFQRSVLLAQGEFSAFLKATDQQRAAILERLTRTDIYKRIGERTAVLKGQYEKALRAVEQQQKGLVLLSAGEVAAIEEAAATAAGELETLDAEAKRLAAWAAWLGQLAERRDAQTEASLAHGEAEAALAARAPDLARLDEDARCREAGEAWRALRKQREEVALFTDRLPALHRDEEGRRSMLATAASAVSDATARKADADAALDRARPGIEAARALGQAWKRAGEELAGVERLCADGAAKEKSARAELERLTTALASATERRDNAETHHAALAYAEPLIEQIAGFSARARHLTGAREQLETASRKRAQAEKAHADLGARRAVLAEQRARSEADRAGLDATCEVAEATLRPLLGDAASVKARREALSRAMQALAKRTTASREARALTGDLAARQARLAGLDSELAAVTARRGDLDAAIAQALSLREALAREAASSADRFADWALILRLSDERAKLEAGSECPLCGSREHPFVARGPDEERADLSRRHQAVKLARDEAQAALAEHDRQANARGAELVGITTAFAEKAKQRADLWQQAAEIEARAASRLGEAGLAESASVAAIEALLADLDEQASATLAAQRALDDAEEALQSAEEARRIEVEKLTRHLADLATLDARMDAAATAATEQAQIMETLGAEIFQEITTLRADLAHCGVAVGDPGGAADLDAAIEQAKALTQAAQAASEERRRADAAERDARSARDLVAGQHAQATARLAEHLEAAEQRRANANAAQHEMLACLDGADPDALERSLKASADAAQLALVDAEKRVTTEREELTRLTTRREEAETRHAEARVRESAARAALAHHLDALGLTDADTLAERLLSDEARKRLTEETSRVRERLVAATATRDDADKRLSAVVATRPHDADAEESTRAEVIARGKALESRRGELHQKVGHCQAQLEEHRRKTRELGDVLEAIDRARRDHDIWQSLHNLIGKNNGEQFKDFAQILNLQELIDNANVRLRWLAPRYSLAVARDSHGLPCLSFLVRDAHFADAERPPTTLSGGETFLVSLALALALADYRAVEMPIETLLLDEGFGTLDTDTLNTAMDALERLQARGTQIGIISHLGGLRERIEARIVVGKLGNGRSEIRFELGVDV